MGNYGARIVQVNVHASAMSLTRRLSSCLSTSKLLRDFVELQKMFFCFINKKIQIFNKNNNLDIFV